MNIKDFVRFLSLCALMTPQTYAQIQKSIQIITPPLTPSAQKESLDDRINLNTASLVELMTLPKIGEKRALAILEYRKKRKFTSVSQLLRVKGIGPKHLARLKNQITVR